MIYDITRTVTSSLAVWPGDSHFSLQQMLSVTKGDAVNLTTLTLSAHTGTHIDAYYHYTADGDHPATMPLDAYVGKARVVSVDKRDGALMPADFSDCDLSGVERLLIRSHVSNLPDDQWAEEFPYLSVELIEWLSGLGVRLIGLDSPSVDALNSKDLPCHHALKRHKMVNIETLMLHNVPDNDYELIALPLKLDHACGSPIRAILKTLD